MCHTDMRACGVPGNKPAGNQTVVCRQDVHEMSKSGSSSRAIYPQKLSRLRDSSAGMAAYLTTLFPAFLPTTRVQRSPCMGMHANHECKQQARQPGPVGQTPPPSWD